LAPLKIKKILASGIVFDRSLIGYYLDLACESFGKSQLKVIYKEFTKATPRKIYFSHFMPDKRYSKWGRLGQPFAEPIEKFIDKRKLLSNYHVMRRFSGVKVVYSDVKSFQELSKNQNVSLNEISRRTHHDYASVHRADQSLKIVS